MPCYKPINIQVKGKYTVVPCSRCIGCRLERSRQWAIRIMNEAKMHENNEFLTLTYRDEELTYGKERATLYPRHLELFWKRLRKEFGDGIRYFACGEYGDTTNRPHYHACVFNLNLKDKEYYSIKNGYKLYRSNTIDRIWSHGDVRSGDVTFESAAYVARYIVGKKLGKESVYYEDEGIEPEFVRMSRRPGIGSTWLDKYSGDVFNNNYQVVRGIKCKPPRYYTDKFKANEPEVMEQRQKEAMEKISEKQDFWNQRRLDVKNKVKKAQINSLTRKQV